MQRRLSLAALLIAFIPLFIAAPVIADDLADGIAFYKKQDYKEAFRLLEKSASAGNAEAQYLIGYMSEMGEGVSKDQKKAAGWYLKSANQGNANAQNNLGRQFMKGEGVKQNAKQAAKWYRAAADQNNAMAQYNLGKLYARGEGVEKDNKKAFDLFEKASEQGHADAQFSVGIAYANGLSVPKDEEKELVWYRKAAENGHLQAQVNLCSLEGMKAKWKDAFKWCQMADEAGSDSVNVAYTLGTVYFRGLGGQTIDNVKAYKYLSRASEKGNAGADFQLGQMYEYGFYLKKDRKKAIEYYEKAAAGGIKDAPAKLEKLR